MASYLVRVIPQRGFETRRRSGIVFSVAGTVIEEGQLTPEIRDDPGLVVTEVGEREAERLRSASPPKDEGGRMKDEGAAGEGALCGYPRANGEPCRNRAREGSRFCAVHSGEGG